MLSHAGEHQKKHALAVLSSRKTQYLRGQPFDRYLRGPLCVNTPHHFHLLKHSKTILKNYRIEEDIPAG
jgi:hypothetical protein